MADTHDVLPPGYDAETARTLAAIALERPKPRCEHITTDEMIAAANDALPRIGRPPKQPTPAQADAPTIDEFFAWLDSEDFGDDGHRRLRDQAWRQSAA